MNARAEDLRILRLAKLYEAAYQKFIQTVLQREIDDDVRMGLASLIPPQDTHLAELDAHERRLRGNLAPGDDAPLVAGELADILDVERATREFYLQNADRIHDEALEALFRKLARDGTRHVAMVESTLDAYRRRRLPSTAAASEGEDGEDGEIALWEGVGDLERHPSR